MGIFTGFLKGIPAPCDIFLNLVGLSIAVAGFVLSFEHDFSDELMMTLLGADGFMMCISLFIAVCEVGCNCCAGEGARACGTIFITMVEFGFLMAATLCGIFSSAMYNKEYWIYKPNSECDTAWESRPHGCYNRSHTCIVDAPDDTFDMDSCQGACWEHTDAMLFAVSTLMTIVSLCIAGGKCCIRGGED